MLEDLERAVEAEYADQRGSWPNNPSAQDYLRHAERLGLHVRIICDEHSFCTVLALYESEDFHGIEPLGLVFQDFSRAELTTWLARIT